MKNFFGLIGTIEAVRGLVGLVKISTKGRRGGTYHDEVAVKFFNDKLAGDAEKFKYVSMAGRLENKDNGDTQAVVGAVKKVKKATLNRNIAEIEGECHAYDFFPAQAGKPQFGNLTLVNGETFVTGVAFRGLSAKLDVKATPSSGWRIVGRLSHREFTDGDGNSRETTDVICQTAEMLYESKIDAELADMQAEAAMAFMDGDADPESDSDDTEQAV